MLLLLLLPFFSCTCVAGGYRPDCISMARLPFRLSPVTSHEEPTNSLAAAAGRANGAFPDTRAGDPPILLYVLYVVFRRVAQCPNQTQSVLPLSRRCNHNRNAGGSRPTKR